MVTTPEKTFFSIKKIVQKKKKKVEGKKMKPPAKDEEHSDIPL
jgi:hypothetical protein